MKNIKQNISFTTSNHLCTGCGICEDVCHKNCINIHCIEGENRPIIDENLCLGEKCGRCLRVCPGVGVNMSSIAKETFTEAGIKEDKYIGRYVGIHTGYSLDEDIRYHSASGGLVSQFLIYLLEKKIIDGAVVTGYGDDHITPHSYIARTRDDVIKARSSKYCPVALNKVGNEIVKTEGSRYVIVGLPCHIQGFRKRASIDKRFREKIVGYFAIYCSSGRTFYAQDYIFKHYGVDKNSISYFAYRDNGCLGNMVIEQTVGKESPLLHLKKSNTKYRDSESKKMISIPFISYYGPLLRSFFKPHRCLTCIDHYGELADVCFGDIHIAPYDQDKVGISSWITRTDYWENLFKQANEEGYIKMDELSPKILNDSQSEMLYPKRRRAGAVVCMDRLIGRKTPVFDKPFEEPSIKDYIVEIVCHCQRFIGRHHSLWFLIELLNRKKIKNDRPLFKIRTS